jgi:hypothetical protein
MLNLKALEILDQIRDAEGHLPILSRSASSAPSSP